MQILSILSENNEVSFIKEKNVFTLHESDDSPPSLMNMSSRTQLRPQLTAQLVLFQPDLIKSSAGRQSTVVLTLIREIPPPRWWCSRTITYSLLSSKQQLDGEGHNKLLTVFTAQPPVDSCLYSGREWRCCRSLIIYQVQCTSLVSPSSL